MTKGASALKGTKAKKLKKNLKNQRNLTKNPLKKVKRNLKEAVMNTLVAVTQRKPLKIKEI